MVAGGSVDTALRNLQMNLDEPIPDPTSLRIVIVDDNRFLLEVVSRLLRQGGAYDIVAEADCLAAGLAACKLHLPDLVLLDINLPDGNGIEAVSDFKAASPAARILLCTVEATDDRILDALRSGAHGFLEKTTTWADFTKAIDRVAAGEFYFCARSTAALAQRSTSGSVDLRRRRLASLSARETEVLQLVSRGESSKLAASKLGVSPRTVDVHRSNLMKKIGVHNVAGLVSFAFEAGLMTDFPGC
jgi:DNA-binding NarL/FixJ family response regulator